ncbi:Flp family type IVb pilin [Sphingomonas sp. MMS24-JH45]
MHWRSTCRSFALSWKNNKGATAIEYGLIAALIAVAAIAAMQGLGNSLRNTFTTTSTKMNAGITAGQ